MISDPYFQMPEFDLSSLMPGDQVFGPIPGFGGPSVFAGQWVLAPWKHRLSWRTWRHVQHTAIVVKAAGPNWRPDGGLVDAPLVGEAEPGGFRLTAIGMERWNPSWIYVRPRWLTEGQGARVAEVARMLSGEAGGAAARRHAEELLARAATRGRAARSAAGRAR